MYDCENCDKEYSTYSSRAKERTRFCSTLCERAYFNKQQEKDMATDIIMYDPRQSRKLDNNTRASAINKLDETVDFLRRSGAFKRKEVESLRVQDLEKHVKKAQEKITIGSYKSFLKDGVEREAISVAAFNKIRFNLSDPIANGVASLTKNRDLANVVSAVVTAFVTLFTLFFLTVFITTVINYLT